MLEPNLRYMNDFFTARKALLKILVESKMISLSSSDFMNAGSLVDHCLLVTTLSFMIVF